MIPSVPGEIVNVKDCVAVAPEASLTWTVKVAEPAADGVPVIAPEVDKFNPAGMDPEVTDHALPPAPPLAVSIWLYAAATCPFGSEVVVIVRPGRAIVTERDCVATVPELSFT